MRSLRTEITSWSQRGGPGMENRLQITVILYRLELLKMVRGEAPSMYVCQYHKWTILSIGAIAACYPDAESKATTIVEISSSFQLVHISFSLGSHPNSCNLIARLLALQPRMTGVIGPRRSA